MKSVKPMPMVKSKPFVEEDDSYLKPGMKDENESVHKKSKVTMVEGKDWTEAPSSKKQGQLEYAARIKAKYAGPSMLTNAEQKAKAMPGEKKRDKAAALRNKLKKMGK